MWLTFDGRLRCTNVDEVFLLLKASDTVAHDLCHPYAHCDDPPAAVPPPELVLKQWCDAAVSLAAMLALTPPQGWTCGRRWSFVALSGRVSWWRAASGTWACTSRSWRSRRTSWRLDFTASLRTSLRTSSRSLHVRARSVLAMRRLSAHLPSRCIADTFDVVLLQSGGVRLLDFSPWGGATLPLLFDWEELDVLAAAAEPPPLRVVRSAQHIRPGLRTGVPLDLYATGEGSALAEFVQRQRAAEERSGRES